jgi:hypothetical protein
MLLTRQQPARVTRRCENPDEHLERKALRALTFTASAHAPRIDRPEPRRGDRQNAALSFHQDIARIGGGGRDEGNSASLTGSCLLAHPFRQCPGLAKTPARE